MNLTSLLPTFQAARQRVLDAGLTGNLKICLQFESSSYNPVYGLFMQVAGAVKMGGSSSSEHTYYNVKGQNLDAVVGEFIRRATIDASLAVPCLAHEPAQPALATSPSPDYPF